MRFLSADVLSPFGRGGLNAYIYCLGDPVNRVDPSGHISIRRFWRWLRGKADKGGEFRPLPDLKSENYAVEVAQAHNYLSKKTYEGDRVFTLSTGRSAVEATRNTQWHHKFIYTTSGELIIGSYDHRLFWPTHAGIVGAAAERQDTRYDVLAAGYIWKKENSLHLSNWSGHYKPKMKRLVPVQQYLENLGHSVKLIRYNSSNNTQND
jgi:hypothetical protein